MIFILILIFFLIDFFSKSWAKMELAEKNKEIFSDIFPSIFSFSLHYNTGIAFSFPVSENLQIFFTIVLLGVFGFYAFKNFSTVLEKIAFCLIVGGALGNFYDRIVFSKVTDFISIWQFPVFNLADCFIFFGVVVLFFLEFQKNMSSDIQETKTEKKYTHLWK